MRKVSDLAHASDIEIAVMTGWISQPGELSVCLPHNLLIEIKAVGEDNSEEEELILPL